MAALTYQNSLAYIFCIICIQYLGAFMEIIVKTNGQWAIKNTKSKKENYINNDQANFSQKETGNQPEQPVAPEAPKANMGATSKKDPVKIAAQIKDKGDKKKILQEAKQNSKAIKPIIKK
jgi:hypothetical protein